MSSQSNNRPFVITAVILAVISTTNFIMLWLIRDIIPEYSETTTYIYINTVLMGLGTALFIDRYTWGWISIVSLFSINGLFVIYKVITLYIATESLSIILIPYALICGCIVFLSTHPSVTDHFFNIKSRQNMMITSGVIIKVVLWGFYYTYLS